MLPIRVGRLHVLAQQRPEPGDRLRVRRRCLARVRLQGAMQTVAIYGRRGQKPSERRVIVEERGTGLWLGLGAGAGAGLGLALELELALGLAFGLLISMRIFRPGHRSGHRWAWTFHWPGEQNLLAHESSCQGHSIWYNGGARQGARITYQECMRDVKTDHICGGLIGLTSAAAFCRVSSAARSRFRRSRRSSSATLSASCGRQGEVRPRVRVEEQGQG